MDVRHLHTLVAVAESDSFAKAADQLFITPAAVSQQIRQIESELGISLFDRAIRPPRLNANGEGLVTKAKELIELFNDFKSNVAEISVRGQLSIGSINGITISLLPDTLRALRRRYPDLRVRIEEGSSQILLRQVKRRELDVAIVSDVMDIPSTIDKFPIFNEPLVVISNTENDGLSWREALQQGPFLRLNRNLGLGSLLDHYLRKYRIKVDTAMELDSSDSIVQMALSGLGCGIVPMGRVSAEASRQLTIMPFGEPQEHRHVVLVQRKNTGASEFSQLLYQELLAQIANRN